MMGTKNMRIYDEDFKEIDKIYLKNNKKVPKPAIIKTMIQQYKLINKKTPKLIVNYWPLSKKKVKIY